MVLCLSKHTITHYLLAFSVKLLEYDKRFATVAEKDFIYYDYKSPMSFGQIFTGDSEVCLRDSFDVVIADPPFLSEECLTKTSVTVKYLAKKDAKLLVCTGNFWRDIIVDSHEILANR